MTQPIGGKKYWGGSEISFPPVKPKGEALQKLRDKKKRERKSRKKNR